MHSPKLGCHFEMGFCAVFLSCSVTNRSQAGRHNSVSVGCGLRRAGATGGGRDGKPRSRESFGPRRDSRWLPECASASRSRLKGTWLKEKRRNSLLRCGLSARNNTGYCSGSPSFFTYVLNGDNHELRRKPTELTISIANAARCLKTLRARV